MNYCECCGLELLPDARFCGRCGQSRTINGNGGATSIGHASQFGMPHLNTTMARNEVPRPVPGWQEEERRDGVILPFGNQPPAGTLPVAPGIPQMGGVPMVHGMPPGTFNAPNLLPRASSPPSSPSPTNVVQSGPSAPSTSYQPTDPQQPPPSHHPHHPHHQHHHHTPSGKLHGKPLPGRMKALPKWLLILIIILIVAFGGAGVLAAVLHVPVPGLSGNANSSSVSVLNTQGNGRTNLQFSGALKNSALTAITYNGCSGGTSFVFQVQGSIDGTPYVLSISIHGSTGTRSTAQPGTYTSNAFVNLHQRSKPISAPWLWEAGPGGVGLETIVVNAGGASGTVMAVMPSYKGGHGGTVTVSGNWTCNRITTPGGNSGNGGGGGG